MGDPNYPLRYINRLLNLSNSFMPSRIFLTALELGLFEEVADQQLTASQIAQRLDTDRRATEILLNALTGMNLLEKKGNLFANSEEVAELLMPDGVNSLNRLFGHTLTLWEAWSGLTQIIRSGHPHKKRWTDEMRLNLALAMKERSKGKAETLAMMVDCFDAGSMLDLGGGPGSFGIVFARYFPQLNVVIFDKDEHAQRLAGEEIAKENLQDRVTLKKGDFFAGSIGDDYDLVLLSSIICLFGSTEISLLLEKVKASLKSGGRVLVWDMMLDESRTKPISSAIFAVNMLVNTHCGRSYSVSEVKEFLHSSGFKDMCLIPMGDFQAVIGIR